MEQFRELVERLKTYKDKWYSMSTLELADFVKIQSNLLKKGIVITKDMLDLPVDDLMRLIKYQLEYNKSTASDEVSKPYAGSEAELRELTSIDYNVFEEERVNIRKNVLNHDVTVKLTCSGKNFSVKWTGSLSSCKINIPSEWNVVIDQSFLLSLYDKHFNMTPRPVVNLNSIYEYVRFLLERYKDFGIVKTIIDYDVEHSIDKILEELDRNAYDYFRSKGLGVSSSIVCCVIYEAITTGKFTLEHYEKMLKPRIYQAIKEYTENVKH